MYYNSSFNGINGADRDKIEMIVEYQSQNKPLKISFFNENGKSIKQYCYHDGVVIEVEENGSIFDCYLMLKDELDSLLKLSNDVERVGSQIIKGAKGWKERSNK